jgi:hypothetical protein
MNNKECEERVNFGFVTKFLYQCLDNNVVRKLAENVIWPKKMNYRSIVSIDELHSIMLQHQESIFENRKKVNFYALDIDGVERSHDCKLLKVIRHEIEKNVAYIEYEIQYDACFIHTRIYTGKLLYTVKPDQWQIKTRFMKNKFELVLEVNVTERKITCTEESSTPQIPPFLKDATKSLVDLKTINEKNRTGGKTNKYLLLFRVMHTLYDHLELLKEIWKEREKETENNFQKRKYAVMVQNISVPEMTVDQVEKVLRSQKVEIFFINEYNSTT